ncbi:MAG: orotidine-5'-phosphate decarboxylase [Hydrogenibacillus sp.]|nr:orotidine-5'-phosphate decarboxylase [Hydrogenibacillus sp.]
MGLTPQAGPSPEERIVVALDVPTPESLTPLVRTLAGAVRRYKIGMSLFYAAHRAAIETVHNAGGSVFLDLKLHDIPSTVARTVRALAALDVDWLTVHALGGREMLEAAQEAAETAGGRPKLFAVTILTSHTPSSLAAIGLRGTPEEHALSLAESARQSGLFGVVASPKEAAAIKATHGDALFVVTPGIRFDGGGSGADDQARTAGPEEAVRAGSDALVVGRPIIQSADPRAAFYAVRNAVARALSDRFSSP